MNKDTYKEMMEQATPSAALIQETKRKMKTEKSPARKRRAIPALATMAAILALIVGTYSLLPAQISNSFTVRAYAITQNADGTVSSQEFGLAGQATAWFGRYDDGHWYLGIDLDIEGENIVNVEFYIADGHFAKHYVPIQERHVSVDENGNEVVNWTINGEVVYRSIRSVDEDGSEVVMGEFVGGDTATIRSITFAIDEFGNERIIRFGDTFESMGSRITLDEIQSDSLFLFAATPHVWYRAPDRVEIQVYVIFQDGERQSETIALTFGDSGFDLGFDSD